jgi:hypothetical protein
MRIAASKEGPINANLQFGPAIRDPSRGIGGASTKRATAGTIRSMGRPRNEINALTPTVAKNR